MSLFSQKYAAGVGLALLAIFMLSSCDSKQDRAEAFYQQGMIYVEAGELEKARLEFLNSIQRDPQNAQAFYQLGLIARAQADLPLAFERIATAVQLQDGFSIAQVSLAELYVYAQRFEEAEKIILALKASDYQSHDFFAVKAATELGLKRLDSALAAVEKALASEPNDPAMYALLAVIAQEKNQPQEVLENLNKAIALSEDKTQYLSLRAGLHRQQKNLVALEQDYRQLMAENPSDDQYVFLLARLLLEDKDKRYSEAETLVRDFLRDHPQHRQARQFLIELVLAVDQARGMEELATTIAQEDDNATLRLFRVNILAKRGAKDPTSLAQAKDELQDMLGDARYPPKTKRQVKAALAEILLREGERDEAMKLVFENLALNNQHEYSHLLKAEDDLRNGRFDEAIGSLRTVLRNNPDSEKGLVLLGRVYDASGSDLLADDAFRQALMLNPRSVDAAMPVARKLIAAQDLERSDAIIARVLATRPGDLKLLLFQSQIKILKKDWAAASESISRLKQHDSGNAYAEYMSGQVDQGRGNCTAAITNFERALALNPKLVPALRELAVCYLTLDKEQALLDYLSQFQERHPDATHAYLVSAQLHRNRGRMDSAIDTLNTGLRRNPGWLDGYALLAGYKDESGDTLAAVTVFKRGMRANPEDNKLPVLLAGFYQNHGETEKAARLYERLLEAQPANVLVINNYAALLLAGDSAVAYEKALVLAEPLKTLNRVQFLDTYGWALYKNKRYVEAENILRRAAESANKSAEIQYHFALSLAALERSEEAKVVLKRAAKLEAEPALRSKIEDALSQMNADAA